MSNRIAKAMLIRHFELLAKAMGWDYLGLAWRPREDGKDIRAVVGHTFIQHNPYYGWSICRMVNEGGGEFRVKNSCPAAEMLAWLEGACFAAWEIERRERSTKEQNT